LANLADNPHRRSFKAWVLTPGGVTWFSFWLNVVLSAAKIVIGIICRSQALLADGLHSASDFASDIAVLMGLRVAGKPADKTHHYGHRKVSALVAMAVGAMLAAAAAWIVYGSVVKFHDFLDGRSEPINANLPFWIALASVPMKEILFRMIFVVGKRHGDMSLIANAWHSRADAFAALATAIGLGGVVLGGPDWQFLDPLTATILAAFLLVAAWKIIGHSASELLDKAPGSETISSLEKAVSATDGVISFHAFRARQVGGKVAMDIHVQVDPDIPVRDGHAIAHAVRRAVMSGDDSVIEVFVHIEPANTPQAQSPS